MSLTKKLLIVFGITLIAAVGIILYMNMMNSNSSAKNEMIAYKLGDMNKKGQVGVELKYDIIPPDVILQSPSGTMFTEKSAKSYTLDEENKTITVIADKEETGMWSVSFNKKDNLNISYQMLIYASESLGIDETDIIKLENTYYLGFKTNSAPGITYHPAITLVVNNKKYNLIIPEDLKDLTTSSDADMIYLPLVIPAEIYTNSPENGVLTLTLSNEDNVKTSRKININFTKNLISMSDIINNQ